VQPVRLTIFGDFWDSQIYKGRLYLWGMDNVLYIYDWETLVESIAREELRMPLVCAFARGDLLYIPRDLSVIFEDREIRQVLDEKFHLVSQLDWSFSQLDIETFLMGQQDSPFDALHDDSSMYMNRLYCLTDTGLYSAQAHKPKNRKYKVDRASNKLWDGLGTAVKTKSETLAVAAADDGLFELSIRNHREPTQVSNYHTVFINWAFTSIYGSSDIESGHLAAYTWTEEEIEGDRDFDASFETTDTRRVREFVRLVSEDEIFGESSQTTNGNRALSWGGQDKLYRATALGIEAVHFTQQYVADQMSNYRPFEPIGKIDLAIAGLENPGAAISGSVTLYGIIVEYEDALIVAASNGEQHVIPGPITRWRVFPQSVRYENHLHVIFDDRIEIWSFNNDYFVDQREKRAGIQFRGFGPRYVRNPIRR
jgi:hypothetical protein